MKNINYFEDLENTVKAALHEDVNTGDLTASLISDSTQANATVICREASIVCGRPWVDEVFAQVDESIQIDWKVKEGDTVQANDVLFTLQGPAGSILTAERTALNFLQTLMATATVTNAYAKHLNGTKTQLLDTRKTLPGLRLAQKYAVNCGGATNHRIGLYDAILIKENHIMAAGSIAKAVSQAKNRYPDITVEVETENLDEVQQALAAGADIIMLDNFTLEMMAQAVELNQNRAKLEVSGNVEMEHLPELAKTGVDFISTGAITKHVRAVDLSMRFQMHA